ncbi:hypothetical protein GGR27_002001 [Lewinella antarctica]|uniref:Uncharacterized protein n=1 Tax=Neolewinella antarctica TaxID=442734 RepID=A0ABX0XBC2_9BACT|nr:hypothetical protein [Neolewinella antarctica]
MPNLPRTRDAPASPVLSRGDHALIVQTTLSSW